MRHGTKSQTLIEFAAIAMVVALALVFGGPFLINSINGRFRLMNNNIHDSLSENLKQTDTTLPTNCTCTSFVKNGCGNPPCSASQMNFSRTCSPLACLSEFQCTNDPSCAVVTPDPCADGGCTKTCDTTQGWYPLCP